MLLCDWCIGIGLKIGPKSKLRRMEKVRHVVVRHIMCHTLSRFATHRHNLIVQNEIVYKNFSTTHTMKIFKRKKCNSCGVITIRMLIFISGKVLMSHFNESHFWSPRKCIMKSAKGQRMTDTLHLESIINSIWLELKSLVSFVAVMLMTILSPASMRFFKGLIHV